MWLYSMEHQYPVNWYFTFHQKYTCQDSRDSQGSTLGRAEVMQYSGKHRGSVALEYWTRFPREGPYLDPEVRTQPGTHLEKRVKGTLLLDWPKPWTTQSTWWVWGALDVRQGVGSERERWSRERNVWNQSVTFFNTVLMSLVLATSGHFPLVVLFLGGYQWFLLLPLASGWIHPMERLGRGWKRKRGSLEVFAPLTPLHEKGGGPWPWDGRFSQWKIRAPLNLVNSKCPLKIRWLLLLLIIWGLEIQTLGFCTVSGESPITTPL